MMWHCHVMLALLGGAVLLWEVVGCSAGWLVMVVGKVVVEDDGGSC